jgi:hypothetical protein
MSIPSSSGGSPKDTITQNQLPKIPFCPQAVKKPGYFIPNTSSIERRED